MKNAYLGKDSVVYYERKDGYVIIAPDPSHPAPRGAIRKVAETVPDVEKLWKKMSAQETEKVSKLNERDFKLREAKMAAIQSRMMETLRHTQNPHERAFILAGLQALENKWQKMQKVSVYGVAFMETNEAPLPPSNTKVVLN